MTLRLAILLYLLVCFNLLYAQNKQYDIVNYNTNNGLPQNSINEIHFDKKGYCWMGTEMGVVRFDGARFKVFGSENIPGLHAERVYAIGEDIRKNIYVLMKNGQLMTTETSGNVTAPRLRLVKKNSSVWLSSLNNFVVNVGFTSKVTDSLLRSFRYGGQEQLGAVTRSGNTYLIIGNKTFYVQKGHPQVIDTQPMAYYHNHTLINNRLVIIRPGGKIESWLGPTPQKHGTTILGPIQRDPNFTKGAFTLISGGTGAYIYTGKTIYRVCFENGQFSSKIALEGIDIKNLSAVYYNQEQGKYYLGSLSSGLYIVTPYLFQYPLMPQQAITDGFRTQVAVEGDSSILCERYLYRKTGYIILPISRQIGATAYADGNDNIYYGMTSDFFKFNLRTLRNRKLFVLDSRPSTIIKDNTDSNCILVCTSLSISKMYQDTFKLMQKVPGVDVGKAIWGLTQTGKDTFLLSTQNGLKWYDFKANRIFRSILDSMTIHCVYPDGADRIWISTYGKGFFLYANGKITALPLGPSNAMKAVHAFIDDGRGNFWLPTNNGLYTTRKDALLAYANKKAEEVYYYAFSTQNGLHSNEFNGGSIPHFVWLKDSMLSLLTIQGPVWFYPHNMSLTPPDKAIYIDEIQVNQSTVRPVDGKLILGPGHGRLSLKVSSPYFGNKENMQLRFRVEGLDEQWSTVPENGEIIIDRIPAGSYTLVVRNLTGNTPGQYIRIMLPILVRPHWYNTQLFYLFLLVFTVALFYWLTKLRTRLLRARNRKLKTLVAMQTRDLNRKIHQLTLSEEALKKSSETKDTIITTVLHDIRSPIRFLYTISKHIASSHRKIQQDVLERHLLELRNSTASLNSFTDHFFTWATSQHRTFSAKYSWVALIDIFQEIEVLYADIVSTKGNSLIVIPTDARCYTDMQLLSTIVRNLLDNANKYTSDGLLKLSAVALHNEVIITVSDTGKGFKPEALQDFLNKDRTNTQSGNGSFIILQLLEFIGGRLEVVSETDKGTEFKVILPLQPISPSASQ